MNIAGILLLAMVCLAGIAVLAIAQPASISGYDTHANNNTLSNQTVNITSWYPIKTDITNTEGAVRTFNVTINQTANVSWLINATEVLNKPNVDFSEYTNTSAVPGYWNVTAYAYNENGNDTRTWWWTVTEDITPPKIVDREPTGTKESIKTNITATFSERMNPSTLNNATIKIVANSTGISVTGDIIYDNRTTVTFNPVSWLDYNETYNVTITTGVQDLAGNNMSSDACWHFTTRSEILRTPFVISGDVTKNGTRVLNPDVTITNLNTGKDFAVETHPNWSYYRMWTDSTHISPRDTLRFNVSDGEIVVDRKVNETEIDNGGFRQDLPPWMPDLVITNITPGDVVKVNETFNITFKVENIGEGAAAESNASMHIKYVDGISMENYTIKALAPGENVTKKVGPFNCPCRDIKICADSDNAVAEFNETNNCMEIRSKCKLPDLKARTYGFHGGSLIEIVDEANGKYQIWYGIANLGKADAGQSNATINITALINGSITSADIINHSIPPVPHGSFPNNAYFNISETFTCLPGTEVRVKLCADSDNEILESKETDNCMEESFNCPAIDKPDLKIVNHSEEWIGEPVNRTFNISYTVKNVGNAIASNSTTCIHGKEDPVPALKPGESYTNTVGPFNLLGFTIIIKLHADCKNNVSESHDGEENCIEYTFGLPHLRFEYWAGWWVSGRNKTFRIEYGVRNQGGAASDNTTVYAYIDGKRDKNVTDTLSPLLVQSKEWSDDWYRYHNSIGPFEMPEDKEKVTYKLCMDRGDGVETCTGETDFGGGACVAEDGTTRFTCGGAGGGVSRTMEITKSCTLTGDMYCSEGVLIRGNDIVIDGNGTGIVGEKRWCTGTKDNPVTPDNHYETRGIRIGWPSRYNKNMNNVTIKNMNIRWFCNGIAIVNADNSRMENCSIHDNGVEDGYTYGITVVNSSYVSIHRCEVYNNTGNLTGECVSGGHGINFDEGSSYCAVTNSSIFNNYLSGILAPPTCKYLYIGNNTIEDNGQCGESGFCAGVNLHWKGGFGQITNSTVENNMIQNNTGSGIYVAQGYTAIRNNTVKGSKNGINVTGDGIRVDQGRVTFLYNNTCCDNEGTDIFDRGFATFGDDNTCDTTENYDDEGTRGCNFYCAGENGACVGDVTGTVFKCGVVVTESCTFNHSMSCRGCSTRYGLIVGADNITIDGGGYTLTGNYSGIGIFSNRTDVAIKNLQVEDFSTGMKIENVSANEIDNCIVRTNLLTGINFSADNGTVRNSSIYDNIGPGILVGGANNTFENNTVARNKDYGIYFSPDAASNNITANAIGDNDAEDVYNDGTSNTGDNNTCDMAHNYWDTGMSRYNCTYPWTPPDLIISDKFENWEEDAHYNVTYTIENIGAPKSRPAGNSTTYLKILDVLRATDPIGTLKPGENYTSTFGLTPKMFGDSDRIKVCADGAEKVEENNPANIFYYDKWYKIEESYSVEELFEDHEDNCLENTFSKSGPDIPEWEEDAACVAADGTEYRCNDPDPDKRIVKKSCVFNGNMECPSGHGLEIGALGITIDGAGFAIGRDDSPSSCEVDESNPGGSERCGIYNPGYDSVTIKKLKIVHFCNGIGLDGTNNVVVGNTIENCNIHDNGNSAGTSHGIHMVSVKDTTIMNNDIHHNRGTGTGCGDGGNGIFLYAGTIPNANNTIVDNDLHDNDRAGFWTKMGMNGCTIKDNRIWGNSVGSGMGTMTGGLVLQCVQSDDNTIENNEVWDNYGRGGIFIGGNDNDLINNNVHDNKGDGIYMGRSDGSRNNNLYDNEVCGNAGRDINVYYADGGDNRGNNNCCNTTENYDDEGTTGCTDSCPCGEKPDLVIPPQKMFGEWVEGQEGSTYKVIYTVENIGKAKAPNSTTIIQIVNGNGSVDHVDALEPGESHPPHTFGPFTIPWPRTHDTITVKADGYEEFIESDETNNIVTKEFPPVLTSIVVLPENATLKVDDTQQFTATAIDQNGDPMEGVDISWSGTNPAVGTVTPSSTTNDKGNTTTVFTANHVGITTITAECGQISGYVSVTVVPGDIEPLKDPSWRSRGGGMPPADEENVSGYEPGPGEGSGELGGAEGAKEQTFNESETVSKETWIEGNPFYGTGWEEIVENVKVVAPVFLII
ncbi:MAG: CARDB domain-containing protein, partial [Euryarchaeota archaeon]|nr:CARDB domain-containing protein [Euryarchaeota archaeon]